MKPDFSLITQNDTFPVHYIDKYWLLGNTTPHMCTFGVSSATDFSTSSSTSFVPRPCPTTQSDVMKFIIHTDKFVILH